MTLTLISWITTSVKWSSTTTKKMKNWKFLSWTLTLWVATSRFTSKIQSSRCSLNWLILSQWIMGQLSWVSLTRHPICTIDCFWRTGHSRARISPTSKTLGVGSPWITILSGLSTFFWTKTPSKGTTKFSDSCFPSRESSLSCTTPGFWKQNHART